MENIRLIKDSQQLDINFESEEDTMDIESIVSGLNTKYPYAKLNPHVVNYKGNGIFNIGGTDMDRKSLEDYVSDLNEAYSPDKDEDWHNK